MVCAEYGLALVNRSFTPVCQTAVMANATLTRDLEIEVVFNARHIGGYATANGNRTAETVIRAASLARLEDAGVARLRDMGVRTIVDLRSTEERERDVTPTVAWAGIDVVAAPVFEQDASPVALSEDFAGFAAVYQRMLETGRDAYRVLVETLARREDRLLVHCAAGKDRTGVAAALLLSLAGVDAETIVSDYARSAELLAPQWSAWEPRMRERGVDPERVRPLMASDPADMAATLVHIELRWGSAEGYLADVGVSAADREAARARMLV